MKFWEIGAQRLEKLNAPGAVLTNTDEIVVQWLKPFADIVDIYRNRTGIFRPLTKTLSERFRVQDDGRHVGRRRDILQDVIAGRI